MAYLSEKETIFKNTIFENKYDELNLKSLKYFGKGCIDI